MEIIWVSERDGAAMPYDGARHRASAWNFLFWDSDTEDGLLLIGDGEYGGEAKGRNGSHASLVACAREYSIVVPNRKPDGAGNCSSGQVWSWSSTGFNVQTPEHLRARIAALLGM